LGYRHRFGEGVPQDLSEMLRWYRAAAAEEDSTAIANLAICYQNGEGVREDEVRAYEFRERAASLGHAGSEIWLAFAMVDGTGCEPDPEAGLRLLEQLAENNSEVAHDLADRLLDGPGLEQDQEAGLKWMRSAAERGHASAITYLGVLYWYGKFVDEDRLRALEYYRQAMEFGDPYAVANVGFATMEGEGVERDVERGLTLVKSSAGRGNAHAALWLCDRYLEGAPDIERDEAEAIRVLEGCIAQEEDGDVLFRLAELVLEGRGLDADPERALRLFELASINGKDTRLERAKLRRQLRNR
ncbi:sel1 repeat family protein, partial [Planctomycetota bacterium]|nr:sel1 repeat family protein [Planctomycetota bacterium]